MPLAIIYNQVYETSEWPVIWKTETVTIIPKNFSPDTLAECRNLACTPLFSKVLEYFVLKRLQDETRFQESQYGGLKGCGVDHFLVKTWDAVIGALEDQRVCASLCSIDFEKAFNRLDHLHCLNALRDHGTSYETIKLAAAFLTERRM